MSKWRSGPTGNMTLSVLDERGRQILRVDMLRAHTMEVGTNGDVLARALNDLALIATMPEISETQHLDMAATQRCPDASLSPLPWRVDYDSTKRLLDVRDSANKRIADRKFPKSFSQDDIERIVDTLRFGLEITGRLGT